VLDTGRLRSSFATLIAAGQAAGQISHFAGPRNRADCASSQAAIPSSGGRPGTVSSRSRTPPTATFLFAARNRSATSSSICEPGNLWAQVDDQDGDQTEVEAGCDERNPIQEPLPTLRFLFALDCPAGWSDRSGSRAHRRVLRRRVGGYYHPCLFFCEGLRFPAFGSGHTSSPFPFSHFHASVISNHSQNPLAKSAQCQRRWREDIAKMWLPFAGHTRPSETSRCSG
jgi:hypothetical protein